MVMFRDLGVINNVVVNNRLSALTELTAPRFCLNGDCRSAWPGGVSTITGTGGITVNNNGGNVTLGTDPNALANALFSSATTYTCNNLRGVTANPLLCPIPGNKNMCFLTNVFGRDGDDIDGFGCSVYGTVGGSWTIRAVGEDYAQTYCQVTCI